MSKTIRRDHVLYDVLAKGNANDNDRDDAAFQKAYTDQLRREQILWERRQVARANENP